MAHWPALQRWADPGYLLAAAGPRTVPVELGAHYLAPGWGQALMPFSAFVAAHLLAEPSPGSKLMAAVGAGAATELGGQGSAQAGPANAVAAGRLHARSERNGSVTGAAAGSGLGAGAAQCGAGAADAPGGAAQRGYLAQHDLFAQVRLTLKPR